MEEIKQYKTRGGVLFNNKEEAEYHENIEHKVNKLLRELGVFNSDINNGGGYIQHNINSIKHIKKELIELMLSTYFRWIREQGYNESMLPRIFSDDDTEKSKVFNELYYRMENIDENGREFDQPYYKANPEGLKEISRDHYIY